MPMRTFVFWKESKAQKLIEKHFTLDKELPGPDHKASLEPDELKEMIKAIRSVEMALGSSEKKPVESEKEIMKIVRKSIVAMVDIPKGVIITEDMIIVKRPGTGIEPKYLNLVVGKKTRKNIKKDEIITFNHIEM